jgi:Leucine-rich repeat (LRR) protein
MFPSNPWVPYRLEQIDLSYNLIPVLTFDITFGTKKVKFLNVSHNSINEIRKHVIGNLTALEVLDLSSNKLTNLNDPEAPLNLPENVTNLYLQNNEIYRIDYEKVANLKSLKEVNLENNQLLHLNKSLIDAVKRGVSVRFEGNPLTCNCEIRDLKHFITEQPTPPKQYTNLVCKQPKRIADMTLEEIDDLELECNELERLEIGGMLTHEYEPLPDLRFREIFL